MATNPEAFDRLVKSDALDAFASSLAEQDCWFGSLNGCHSFNAATARIDERIGTYRSFHQFNIELPARIHDTKTNIGEPIARVEEVMKETGLISDDTPMFVRIDQVERLYRSDVLRQALGVQYRRVINKALSKRDSRVSYRIGTRPYAWDDDLTIFGTADKLEHIRDYRIVDLDEKLRRKEDRTTWLFPEFATDTFRRRLRHGGITPAATRDDSLKQVFGETPKPEQVAGDYARNSSADKILRLGPDWPMAWTSFLEALFQTDPFTAGLAGAWARQRGQSGKRGVRLQSAPPVQQAPWNKSTWRKERVRQCLMQIAARCAQRLRWSGKETILSLSTPNISVFLSVCHEIWDAFLRAERGKTPAKRVDPLRETIDRDVQSVGIETASKDWYTKIAELPNGHDRQRFVDVLGRKFRKGLLDDVEMSYPGYNGFSLAVEELDSVPVLARFLCDATDYGDLYSVEHTTKGADRRRRVKWYLSPILSAYFQIPDAHTKEPYYTTAAEVLQWLNEAKVCLDGIAPITADSRAASQEESSEDTRQLRLGF
jgi:hypothetical protein